MSKFNKSELLSTYTAEQLSEMAAELQSGKGNKVFKVKDNKNYQKEIDEFFRNSVDKICNDILEQKNNAMAMEFTRIIGELLRENGLLIRFSQAEIGEDIHHNIIERKYGIAFDSMDFSQHDKEFTDKIKELEEELEKSNREHAKTLWEYCDSVKKEDYEKEIDRLQSEVEKYRKAFEDAKKERDCQIAEYQKKIDELYYSLRTLEGNLKVSNVVIEETIKNENGEESNAVKFDSINQFAEYVKCFYTINLDYIQKILQGKKGKQNNFENIANFLPTEPIKVADILIHNYKQGLYPVYQKDE